ncbi:MAG: DUF3857 domain-containing protein [Bacteroidales bacterium]|nr:DUF3857 domain-containing protein [Bacteroidales bacterium]
MKRFLSVIFILLFFWTTVYAQDDFSTKFGEVSRNDFELKQNPNYKDAPAVVMDDLGKVQFFADEEGVTIIYNRRTKIRIFTDAGKSYAKVEIPYTINNDISEMVYDVEAIAFNHEGGKIVKTKLKPKDIHTKKLSDTRFVTEFVIPDVKEGSVVEYRYTWKTNSLYDLPSWNFQWTIPVVYSDYQVRMIPFFRYNWELQGSKQLDYDNTYIDHTVKRDYEGSEFYDYVHDFAMSNIPAYTDTTFVPSVSNYLMRVNFQLSKEFYPNGGSVDVITTWNKLMEKLLKDDNFGKYLKKSVKLSAKLINEGKLKKEPLEERFNTVMDYMKDHFKWNGDLSRTASKKPEKLISDKTGNSADINLMTVSMLRAVGIDASPVLISTRNHGIIRGNYPYLPFFNNVIVLAKINGKQVLSDATAPNCLNNRIPVRCINDKGLVVDNSKIDWVLLNKMPLSTTETKNEVVFQDDELKVKVEKEATEYDAVKYRNSNLGTSEVLSKKLESENYKLNESTVSVQNQRKDPYKLNYSFETPKEVNNDKISISPFFNEIGKTNMFTETERSFPVDLVYPNKMKFVTTITVPDGYVLDSLQKPLDINNDLYELNYSAIQTGNKLIISLKYSFNWPVYPAFDYLKLKSFFARVIEKGNEKIVLTKQKGNL